MRPQGGPGTADPGRVHYPFISLKELVKSAYPAKDYELVAPGWMDAQTFEIDATMPPSTTKEQFQVMLQNLLAERFKLKIHRETRKMPVYSLVVSKGGPKLGPAGSIHQNATFPDGTTHRLDNQLVRFPGRVGTPSKWIGLSTTMKDLADALREEIQRPVTDDTGLKDKYDFTLAFSQDATGAAAGTTEVLPDIFSALRSIGLRLDAATAPMEVTVIDHIEKTPTGN